MRAVLGDDYGGPSLGYTPKRGFFVYVWYDAPVGMDTLAEGHDLQQVMDSARAALAKR